MVDDSGPYGIAALCYWEAGWHGVLPLPRGQKTYPPAGWTGHDAPEPSWADVQSWLDGGYAPGNLALRLPAGVIGLDVDAYGEKQGARTLSVLEGQWGQLPDTWMSSARDDGVSGIRLYRLPAAYTISEGPDAVHWPGEAGPNIEIIQHGHRYVVAWPSTNPHADGALYRWHRPQWSIDNRRPDNADSVVLPQIDELPELPEAWARGLARAGERRAGVELADDAAKAWLEGCREGDACDVVLRCAQTAAGELGGKAGARHEVMRDAVHALARYGGEGHAGARDALGWLRPRFIDAVRGDRGEETAAGEWLRALTGAVRLAAAADNPPRQACDCALWAGEGVGFNPGPFVSESTVDENGSALSTGDVHAGVDSEPTDLVELLLSRMLDRDALEAIPAPRPLIRDLLDLDSESWVIGAPGGFKSFVALDWACHVATGLPWRGKAVTRGRVVYVAAEGRKGIPQRVRAWEATYGVRAEGVVFLPQPVQVSNELGWSALAEACRRIGPALVVLDTQARITVGLDENNNGAMGQLVDAVRRLKDATGACVLVVHHTGRDGRDARGASAVDGAQDTEIRVERPKTDRDRRGLSAIISLDKQKDGDESEVFDIRLEVVKVGEAEDGRQLTSLALIPLDPFGVATGRPAPDWVENITGNQADVLAAFRAHSDDVGATRTQALQWIKEHRALTGRPEMAKTSFDSAVRDLVKDRPGRPALLERMGVGRIRLADEATGIADIQGVLKQDQPDSSS